MLIIPSGVKIHLALGRTDMRKGFDSLAVLVQEALKKDPFSGHLFAFRGKKADTMKILFWDGNGLCLFTKRLQHGRFIWPSLCEPGGTVTLTPAQLAMLIEGIIGARQNALGSPRLRAEKVQKPAWNMAKLLDRISVFEYDSSCSLISTIFLPIRPCCIVLCATWLRSLSGATARSKDSS
jgi:transposase